MERGQRENEGEQEAGHSSKLQRVRAAVPASHHPERYLVKVVTGNLRGAGTNAPAWIQLIGSHGATARIALGDQHSELFQRATVREFEINVPKVGCLHEKAFSRLSRH